MEFIANHLYLLSAVYFLFWWILFFIVYKKNRANMLILATMGIILGPMVQWMHLQDWWQPNFLFDSVIKLEDIIFGIGVTGTASAVYAILRNQNTTKAKSASISHSNIIIFGLINTSIVFGLFIFLGVNSFWSSLVGLSIPIILLIIKRPSALFDAFLVGVLLTIMVIPGYLFGILINPSWVENEWLLHMLSGILVFGIPIEELIWFFFAGFGLAAFQELFLHKENKNNS